MRAIPILVSVILACTTSASAWAKTVHYELTATRGTVNLSGKQPVDFALMINGSIPAPTLEFSEGDEAEIVVKNQIAGEELSLHWHGLLLPNEMDGVPYVTTPSISTGESYTFRFKLRQHGTYWYHSHTDVQEQKGLFGAFIIHPKKERLAYDKEVVAVLSDWSDENGLDILKNLKKDGDYYLSKKGTIRSWIGAIQAGKLGTYLGNEWTRMGGMDLSDVGYDAFLINGKNDSQLTQAHPGERIRVRIINAAASTYFDVSLGQTPMKVISADGIDVQPIYANHLLMGMAETYDVLFTVPEHKNYELRATAQDGTGSAHAWLGMGEKIPARAMPLPDPYAAMNHGGHGGHGDHERQAGHSEHAIHASQPESKAMDHTTHNHHVGHDMHATQEAEPNSVQETLTVDGFRSLQPTNLPAGAPIHDLKLVLGGDMSRYVWHINGKAIHEEMNIEIKEGEVVRLTFVNETMMHHPMHLHGHFFRVLTAAGEFSPLKHTVDVPPHGTRVIEFYANEPGLWMLHCHNLFHMKSGMARMVNYVSFQPKYHLPHEQMGKDPHSHDDWYTYGRAEAATNHAQGYLRFSQTWNQVDARVEGRNTTRTPISFTDPWEIESDLFYRRWFGQYLNLLGGGTLYEKEVSATAGLAYRLPLLIETQLIVNHHGKLRLDVEKKFQWTSTVYTDVDLTWRPDQAHALGKALEYEVSLMYSPKWSWAAGLMLTDDSLGAGIQVQF